MGAGLNIVNLASNVPVTFWLFMFTGHKLLDNITAAQVTFNLVRIVTGQPHTELV